MPLAVLAAGGRYKWVQLHDAGRGVHTIFKSKTQTALLTTRAVRTLMDSGLNYFRYKRVS